MQGFFSASELQSKPKVSKFPLCGKCGLYEKCYSPKFKPHEGSNEILIVADKPEKEDDMQGSYFCGEGGDMLRKAARQLGVRDIDSCSYAYAISCHTSKPDASTALCCRPKLRAVIDKIKPKVIIPLGTRALASVLAGEYDKNIGEIEKWLGWQIPSKMNNAWIVPNYSLHDLKMGKKNEIQFLFFKKYLNRAFKLKGPVKYISDLEKEVDIIYASDEICDLLSSVEDNNIVAFDYETTGLKPDAPGHEIVSCSLCVDGDFTFAFMLENKKVKNHLRQFLRSKCRKVASNMKFEERWSLAKMKTRVRNWHWDTMLAAHVLDNRPGITSIKFLSYVHLGIADYDSHIAPYLKAKTSNGFNKIEKIDRDELLLYNGIDSLLEYKMMEFQKSCFPSRKAR